MAILYIELKPPTHYIKLSKTTCYTGDKIEP